MTAEPGEDPERPGDDEVGSLGEEAAKLLGALSDWARERPADESAEDREQPPPAAGLGEQLAAALRSVDDHVATGAAECRYCPVCRVVHAVRSTSPEVREHLTAAAGSLLEAAAGLLATHVPGQQPGRGPEGGPRRPDGVQRIELDPDGPPDPDGREA